MSASISLGFPPSAVFLLRPSNSAAQLAFSDVVNFAAEKQQQPDHGPDWVPTFTKFMWLASKDQVASREVGHLIRRRFVAAMPGSSSPAPGTDDDQHSASIWSGGYFITLDAETPTSQWSLGRRSSSYLPDLVLTLDKITHLSRIQAWLRVDAETRRAYLTSRERGRFSINSISPSETPGEVNRLSFNSRSNTFAVGELQYSFDYTDFIATPEGQRTLANYLTKIYGTGSQPPPEAIAATPTPGPTTKTIGAYTLYGILGTGTFGSVRPATSARGDKVLAIKTIVSRSTSSGVIQLMQNLTRLLNSTEWAKRVNILRLVEAFTIPGNLEEIHLVLEPFTPITLEKLPVHTHYSQYEIILRDCLRGLQFLHDNGFVHSDIKPTNIGLVNVYPETVTFDVSFLDSVQQRPLKAFLLDVDSTIPLSPGSRLAASPGRGGTVSYLSPERENVGIDHTEDVWALGVSACRVIFGTHPFRDAQGNPWRHEAPSLDTRRKTFHEQYENILDQIANYSLISGAIKKFMLSSLRFRWSKYAGQNRRRITSQEALSTLIKDSVFLKDLEKAEEIANTVQGAAVGLKRRADVI